MTGVGRQGRTVAGIGEAASTAAVRPRSGFRFPVVYQDPSSAPGFS